MNTLDSTGARRETIRYSTYGVPFGMAASDVNGSGTITIGDRNAVNAQIGKSYGQAGYTVLLDVDLDGDVDINDWNIANGQFGVNLGHGVLSFDVTSTNGGNRIGYAGYAWEPAASKYAVRHRVYDPLRGRWSRRDPFGYVDSPTLYSYVNDQAMTALDPKGLTARQPTAGANRSYYKSGVACAPASVLHADSNSVNGCGFDEDDGPVDLPTPPDCPANACKQTTGGCKGRAPNVPPAQGDCETVKPLTPEKCGEIPDSKKQEYYEQCLPCELSYNKHNCSGKDCKRCESDGTAPDQVGARTKTCEYTLDNGCVIKVQACITVDDSEQNGTCTPYI